MLGKATIALPGADTAHPADVNMRGELPVNAFDDLPDLQMIVLVGNPGRRSVLLSKTQYCAIFSYYCLDSKESCSKLLQHCFHINAPLQQHHLQEQCMQSVEPEQSSLRHGAAMHVVQALSLQKVHCTHLAHSAP